jgi:drug/metabolite transporter (DMT)-like permease
VLFGILLGLATSGCWALGNVFIQRSGRAIGTARALVWALGLGGLVAAGAAVLFDQRTLLPTLGTWIWLLVAAAAGLLAYACLFYAFTHAKLSVAVPFVSSWSIIAGLLSLTVFHQAARPGQLGGAAVVITGVLLVSVGAARGNGAAANAAPGGWRPLAAAFSSGVGFGVMVPAMTHITAACGTFGTAAAVYLIGLLLAVPIALVLGVNLGRPPRAAWPAVIGAGLFETLGFVCLNAAGRLAPVALVAPVASLAAVLTVLYAAVFLRERPGRLALWGAFVASLGVVVLAL